MREMWARRIAYLTGVVVIVLSVLFAKLQNPADVSKERETRLKSAIVSENNIKNKEYIRLGKQIYVQQSCAMCHSVKGDGNPRNPLDGASEQLTDKQLKQWVVGAPELEERIGAGVLRLKQANQKLTEDQIELLIFYLRSI